MIDSDNLQGKSEKIIKALDKSFGLKDLLGKDWKERCVLENISEEFTQKELTALNNQRKVENQIGSDPEKFASRVNVLLGSSGVIARVIEVEDEGQKVFITNEIAGDTMFQLVSTDKTNIYNGGGVRWQPEKMGIISASGNVWSIDKMLTRNGEMMFSSCFYKDLNSEKDFNLEQTPMPITVEDFAGWLHEMGHSLRLRDVQLSSVDIEMVNFMNIVDLGDPKMAELMEPGLNYETVLKLKELDERGAWAIAFSALKEIENSISLGIASKSSWEVMKTEEERCLGTYDKAYLRSRFSQKKRHKS
jgi:hypothetical protein